jgi:hypothetical protein
MIMLRCITTAIMPGGRSPMSEREMEAKLVELDRLLNDPDVRMDPHRVWLLLQEISGSGMSAQPVATAA